MYPLRPRSSSPSPCNTSVHKIVDWQWKNPRKPAATPCHHQNSNACLSAIGPPFASSTCGRLPGARWPCCWPAWIGPRAPPGLDRVASEYWRSEKHHMAFCYQAFLLHPTQKAHDLAAIIQFPPPTPERPLALLMVSAGDQPPLLLSYRMSRHMWPLLYMCGCTGAGGMNVTTGDSSGYRSVNWTRSRYTWPGTGSVGKGRLPEGQCCSANSKNGHAPHQSGAPS